MEGEGELTLMSACDPIVVYGFALMLTQFLSALTVDAEPVKLICVPGPMPDGNLAWAKREPEESPQVRVYVREVALTHPDWIDTAAHEACHVKLDIEEPGVTWSELPNKERQRRERRAKRCAKELMAWQAKLAKMMDEKRAR